MSHIGPEAETERRLLMLGLDAASLPFIQGNRRKLPVLTSLLEEGTLRQLESPALHLSASVWPTFTTGRPPGGLGRGDGVVPAGAGRRPAPVWKGADRCGSAGADDCTPMRRAPRFPGRGRSRKSRCHALSDAAAVGTVRHRLVRNAPRRA